MLWYLKPGDVDVLSEMEIPARRNSHDPLDPKEEKYLVYLKMLSDFLSPMLTLYKTLSTIKLSMDRVATACSTLTIHFVGAFKYEFFPLVKKWEFLHHR